jgi:hypothetical protein
MLLSCSRRWLRGLRDRASTRGRPAKTRLSRPPYRPYLEILEGRCLPSTFLVNTANDEIDGGTLADPAGADGLLSLREAITAANLTAGPSTINFKIPGSGVQTIALTSALPTITAPVLLDGYSQPGASANTSSSGDNALLLIQFSGASAGANGLVITGGGSTVQGLVINGFSGDGILLQTGGNNVVQGDFIGTSADGTNAAGNQGEGVLINGSANNTIGGNVAAARDIISDNGQTSTFAGGIYLYGSGTSGNVVAGNLIGTDASGTAPLGNHWTDVGIIGGASGNTIGGSAPGAGNVISASAAVGVEIHDAGSSGNVVAGNFIGTDKTGTAKLGNTLDGILIYNGATGNTIGGTDTNVPGAPLAGAGNVISGNAQHGILILNSGTSGNRVEGNYIGTDVTGTVGLGNVGLGVDIAGGASGNFIGAAGAGNIISDNGQSSTYTGGIYISDTGTTGNIVAGNFIGTDASGTARLGNHWTDVGIYGGAAGNTIGGSAPGAGNVISASAANGVEIHDAGSSGNVVAGNFIGTDKTGTAKLGNASDGVLIWNGATGNTIGGTDTNAPWAPLAGAGNLISGNGHDGVDVVDSGSSGNMVQGNYIGTDVTGTVGLGNVGLGVIIAGGASGNFIGAAGAGNVISDNSQSSTYTGGIYLYGSGTSGNVVAGNLIGTDASGTAPLGNHWSDVGIIGGASGNTIGGSAPGAGNVISASAAVGVEIHDAGSSGNVVAGNLIGTDKTGTAKLGNALFGVFIWNGASGNTIGGTDTNAPGAPLAGAGNVISGNSYDGVLIIDSGTSGNLVQGNYIGTDVYGNAVLGNSRFGVLIDAGAAGNTVGTTPLGGAGNLIAGNSASGVSVFGSTSTGNSIEANSIYANGGLGIDLGSGGNNGENAPTLVAVGAVDAYTGVAGTLSSLPSTSFILDFYASVPSADPSVPVEGARWLGDRGISTDSNGNAAFSLLLPALAPGEVVTATATDPSGNTSEFSVSAAPQPFAILNVSFAGALTYTASSGIANNLTVSLASGVYSFNDTGEAIFIRGGGSAGWSGSGTNTVTGPQTSVATISIDLLDGKDTVNVQSIANPTTVTEGAGATETVSVGNTADGVQDIQATLTVNNPKGHSVLSLDDSADSTGRKVTLSAGTISGLAPQNISFDPNALSALKISGGSGGNTFTITGTGGGYTTALTSRGADVIDVLATTGSLSLIDQAGNNSIYVGTSSTAFNTGTGTTAAINGAVSVSWDTSSKPGHTHLYVDDSADTTSPAVTLDDGSLSGLALGGITWTTASFDPFNPTGGVVSLAVAGSGAGSTYTVNNTSALFDGTTLYTGGGDDTVNVLATSDTGSIFDSLDVINQGGQDQVYVGTTSTAFNTGQGTIANIKGVVNVFSNHFYTYTTLYVDDSADSTSQTVTLNDGALSGLRMANIDWTPNFSGLGGGVTSLAIAGGAADNTYTVNNTSALADGTILYTGGGNDIINVLATTGALTLNGQLSGRLDSVFVGTSSNDFNTGKGTTANIKGIVNLTWPFNTTSLNVDDSADSTSHRVTLDDGSLSGLAPADISWTPTSLYRLDVIGSSSGSTYDVKNTSNIGNGTALRLSAPSSNPDTVNVLATNGSLDIIDQGGNNSVYVGTRSTSFNNGFGTTANIYGPVSVSWNSSYQPGFTSLYVDDSADTTSRTVTLGDGSLSGLAPGAINWTPYSSGPGGGVTSLGVVGSAAGSTYTVKNTSAFEFGTTLSTRGDNNTVNVLATSATGSSFDSLRVINLGGQDSVYVGVTSTAFNAANGTTDNINGIVNVFGVGATKLYIDDSSDTTSPTVTLEDGALSGLAPVEIHWGPGGVTSLAIAGSAGGVGAGIGSTYTVNNTSALANGTTLYTGPGNHTINVLATTGALTIDGQPGYDTFTVNFGNLGGPVNIADTGPSSTDNGALIIKAAPGTNYIQKTPGQVTWGKPATETITYSGIYTLTIDTSTGTNNTVLDPGSPYTTIIGGPGVNDIVLANTAGNGVVVDGGAGTNMYEIKLGNLAGPVTINNPNPGANDSLIVDGAPGDNTIVAGGTQISAGTQTIALNAPLAGLTVNGGSGNNQITVANLGIPVQSLTLNGGPNANTFALVNAGANVAALAIAAPAGATNQVQVQGSLPAATTVNVAPTASLSNNGPITYGNTVTVSFTNAADSSSGATPAGLHYAYSLDDGGAALGAATYANSGSSPTSSYAALDAGAHTVYARIMDQGGNSTQYSTSISVTPANQTLTWAAPAPIIYGEPLGSSQLNATVAVVGPAPAGGLSYSPASGTVLGPGTQTLSVTAAATTDYNAATTSVSLSVLSQFLYLLDPKANRALNVVAKAQVNIPGPLLIDSNSSNALYEQDSAQVSATTIQIVGGASINGKATVSPTPTTGITPFADPLSSLTGPSTNGLPNNGSVSFKDNAKHTIQPGIYGYINVGGSATVTMQPGLYLIEGYGMVVNGNGTLTGNGVTIYNTTSNYPQNTGTTTGITLSGNGTINLTAATTSANGAYPGVVIYQGRSNTRAMSISGLAGIGGNPPASITINGTIYVPSAQVAVSGTVTLSAGVVANTMSVTGNGVSTQVGQDGTSSIQDTATAGTLLTGDLYVYVNDPAGYFTANELNRIQDAITTWDTLLSPYNVTIYEVSAPTQANLVLDNGTSGAAGSYADGVLGSFTPGEITLIQGWNWYDGANPSQIGADQYDFQTVVTHELGHALGLSGGRDPNSPMYEILPPGTILRTPTVADLNLTAPPEGADPELAAGLLPTARAMPTGEANPGATKVTLVAALSTPGGRSGPAGAARIVLDVGLTEHPTASGGSGAAADAGLAGMHASWRLVGPAVLPAPGATGLFSAAMPSSGGDNFGDGTQLSEASLWRAEDELAPLLPMPNPATPVEIRQVLDHATDLLWMPAAGGELAPPPANGLGSAGVIEVLFARDGVDSRPFGARGEDIRPVAGAPAAFEPGVAWAGLLAVLLSEELPARRTERCRAGRKD